MSSFSDSVFDKIYLLAVEWGCLLLDIQTLEIVRKANRLANDLCTRDPHRIAQELGIEVIPLAFKKQRGAYKVLMRNRFIFIKDDLHPVMERIVMLHEIGHDALHRKRSRLAASRNLTFSICGKAGWNTKQTSLLPKSPCLMMKYWNISKMGMIFSRSHGQCTRT